MSRARSLLSYISAVCCRAGEVSGHALYQETYLFSFFFAPTLFLVFVCLFVVCVCCFYLFACFDFVVVVFFGFCHLITLGGASSTTVPDNGEGII